MKISRKLISQNSKMGDPLGRQGVKSLGKGVPLPPKSAGELKSFCPS